LVGVGSPLKLTRQYKEKYRSNTDSEDFYGNVEAEVNANDDFVILSWKQENLRVRKREGNSSRANIALRRYKRSNCYSNILIKEFAWKI
jgi:hypothetical protein